MEGAGKIICFGEPLLRFSPDGNGQWLQAAQLPVHLGGAELNVATALGGWHIPVSYCTGLPDNYLSQDLIARIQQRQILTDTIQLYGDRIGTYYLSRGKDVKHEAVIYDRAHSAFGSMTTGIFDWDKILRGVTWFHFSAINPALNESVAAVCLEALEAASGKNIRVSVDLNYRQKLWKGRAPQDSMAPLLAHCDVVMGNIWSARSLLGIPVNEPLIQSKEKTAYLQHAQETAAAIMKKFPRVQYVANTFRFDEGTTGISYFAVLNSGHQQTGSPHFMSDAVLEKVGTGDCFMAGLIYGLYEGMDPQRIINFAAAAAFGKFFEIGDATAQSLKIIQERIRQYE